MVLYCHDQEKLRQVWISSLRALQSMFWSVHFLMIIIVSLRKISRISRQFSLDVGGGKPLPGDGGGDGGNQLPHEGEDKETAEEGGGGGAGGGGQRGRGGGQRGHHEGPSDPGGGQQVAKGSRGSVIKRMSLYQFYHVFIK